MDDTDGTMDDFKIELFVFPDGTAVEMMVFDTAGAGSASPVSPASAPAATTPPRSRCAVDHAPEPAAAAVATATPAEVNACPVCRGQLVHPVDWERTGDAVWRLRLRCPECESERTVVMGRSEVEQMNRELYHGTQELAREAERVSRHNFEDEARRFVDALRSGQIEPIDF
jgi:hypothetical protein